MMTSRAFCLLVVFVNLNGASAQTSPQQLKPILDERIQPSVVAEFELRHYLLGRVPGLPTPTSAAQWASQAETIRRELLNDVIFHGWPREWVNTSPKFKDLGLVKSFAGVRIRKLIYEIVPGFWSSAILYEPMNLTNKNPAILVLNGHGPQGKAIEYKQKLCINYARRGILTLSPEWFGYGELSQPENGHDFAAHLDLVGASAIGLFYLAMRRCLDYLYDHPYVDRERLGVTGLSGGGWQTIVLSTLDERVSVAVPVAGYGSLRSNIIHPSDTSEIEEDATDFRADGRDYTILTAMRAPRPTLLIYNAEDDCCFRAPFVRQDVYDDIKPFFRLYGKVDALSWYENFDPGTHNYEIDNRQQSYSFFAKYFNLPIVQQEIQVDTQVNSYDELAVGLPQNNLTVLSLARKMAQQIKRTPIPTERSPRTMWANSERERLKSIVRYQPVKLQSTWKINNTSNRGLESLSYRLEFTNGLSATALWAKATTSPNDAPSTIVLNDSGKKAAAVEVSSRVNRGEQVLAGDLLFTGDLTPEKPSPADYALILTATGDRPIGLEAAQLIALARWLGALSRTPQVRIESTGLRSQVIALIAACIEPSLFSEISIAEGVKSLAYLLDTPVAYRTASDLFCLDLFKEFDLDLLAQAARPVKISYLKREVQP